MSEGDDGGDEVCWLDMLCPECGAMPSEGDERCWRCGTDRRAEGPDVGAAR